MFYFTIIIPTFNRAHFLPKAIESVIAQSFTDWELIVVDDGSTDNTEEIVKAYDDSRIKYVYQENAERAAARNNGIQQSQGEYICFLDSDDYYPFDFLEILYAAIVRAGKNAFFLSAIEFVDADGRFKRRLEPLSKLENMPLQILTNAWVVPCIACVHKSIFINNLFDERFSLWEDTHLWIRVLLESEYFPVPKTKVFVVEHDNSTVNSGMQKVKFESFKQYVCAISDLQHKENISAEIPFNIFTNYKLKKAELYWYQARKNGQFIVSFRIALWMLNLQVTIKNLSILLKTPLALVKK